MSFYVTLPSNTAPQIFPNNTPGHFFVKLPQIIELTKQYEVGLVEIQFPNTHYSGLPGELWFQYLPPKGSNRGPKTLKVRAGLFSTPEVFIEELNKLCVELQVDDNALIKFFIGAPPWKKVGMKLFEKGAQVKISDRLKNKLGFPSSTLSDDNVLLFSTVELEMDSDVKNVYVYSDLVAARPVGDVMVPLLRTVPILDRLSPSVFRLYDQPHYVPLSRFSFDTVEILLTTDTGKTIAFNEGTSVLTLHFRTRKHSE